MCQLLGICANRRVNLDFSFREWRHRGDQNPHGYGFAFWEGKEPRIIKSATNLFMESPTIADDIRSRRSKIFLCHVRFKSVGAQDGRNTHPFMCGSGKGAFVFAHNGTLTGMKSQPLRGHRPDGETDSEHAFFWLIEKLSEPENGSFETRLKKYSDEIRRLGNLNYLLSDGKTLWAYADASLHLIERTPPYGGELAKLQDDGYSISLAEVKRPDERAVLIATLPLTDEPDWRRIKSGGLVVIRDGRVISELY